MTKLFRLFSMLLYTCIYDNFPTSVRQKRHALMTGLWWGWGNLLLELLQTKYKGHELKIQFV